MAFNIWSGLRMQYYAFRYLTCDGSFAGAEADQCADERSAIASAVGLHDWTGPGLVEIWQDNSLIFTAEVAPASALRVSRAVRGGSRQFIRSWEYLSRSYRQWREREQVETASAQAIRDRATIRKPVQPSGSVRLPRPAGQIQVDDPARRRQLVESDFRYRRAR